MIYGSGSRRETKIEKETYPRVGGNATTRSLFLLSSSACGMLER